MKICFDVKNQIITRTDRGQVIANSADYLESEITFSEEWASLEKTMTFKNGNLVYTYVLSNDKITQDHHLNLGVGTWKVSIIGTANDQKIITNECNLSVNASGWIGSALIPPESIWNQLLVIIQSLHTEAASSAVIRSAVQKYIEDNYDALVKEVIIVGNVKEIIDELVDDGTISELLNPIVAEDLAGQAGDWLEDHVDPDTGYVIDNSLTIPLAAADAKKVGDELTNLNSALTSVTNSILWNLGNIIYGSRYSSTDGTIVESTKYGRAVGLKSGYGTIVGLMCNSNVYEISICYYDATGDSSTGTGFLGSTDYGAIQNMPQSAAKFGLNYRRIDRATLSSADNTAFKASIYVLYATDASLSVSNKSADAKATGDAIRAIEPPLMSVGYSTELGEIDFVQGGISTSGTFNHDQNNRITSGYIPLRRSASVTVNSGSSYQHRCLYFNAKGAFIYTAEQSTWHQGEFEYPSPSEAKFFRIVVAPVSGSATLSPSTDTDTVYSLTEHFTVIDDWNLRGKKISILGDSISTFGGSVDDDEDNRISPEGNPYTWPGNKCRYPQLNLLTSVNETYWMKIIEHFGLVLGINESWAGTCVAWDGTSTTGRFAKENCISAQERIDHLDENGTPDIILVNGGTNDIGRNRPVGTFNTENPMSYTDEQIAALDVTTFANAFRAMLIRLQKTYKNALIIVVMPNYTSAYYTPDEADAYNEIIKEACDYFGVMWIDARISGVTMFNKTSYLPDGIHYNAAGMEMLYTVIKNAIERTYQ